MSEEQNVNVTEKLQEVDRMVLELAKQRQLTALAESKTALARCELAELTQKYIVLQVYVKYSLTSSDSIDETGSILRGGAVKPDSK